MASDRAYKAVGEVVFSPGSSVSLMNEGDPIAEVFCSPDAAQFLSRVRSKLETCYFKGAVYVGSTQTSVVVEKS